MIPRSTPLLGRFSFAVMMPLRNLRTARRFAARLLGALLVVLQAGVAGWPSQASQSLLQLARRIIACGSRQARGGELSAAQIPLRNQSRESEPRHHLSRSHRMVWVTTVAQLTGDTNLTARLIQKFEPLLTEAGAKRINRSTHVDYRVFGVVPLEIYLQTKDKRCLDLGLSLADAQWAKTTPDGITAEARYWIDDMYMIPAVQVQAFRATGEAKYLDRAALTMGRLLRQNAATDRAVFHGTNAPFSGGGVMAGWRRARRSCYVRYRSIIRNTPASSPAIAR